MTLRIGIGLCLGLLLLAAGLLLPVCFREQGSGHLYEFTIMGTCGVLDFREGDEALAERCREAVWQTLCEVNACADIHNPESELSRLNAAAHRAPFHCSDLLWQLLQPGRRAAALSDGEFDISVKPLLDCWGFYRRRSEEPSAAEIAAVLSRVGLEKVQFNDRAHTVFFTVPGMALDLGGTAKGSALDLAAARVEQLGIRCGVINLGGNIRTLSRAPDRSGTYQISIRDPRTGGLRTEKLRLKPGQAAATSGSYERFMEFNGKRQGHIISPRTGYPVSPGQAVTVIAPAAAEADMLSTIAYLLGETGLTQVKAAMPGVSFYFYPEN